MTAGIEGDTFFFLQTKEVLRQRQHSCAEEGERFSVDRRVQMEILAWSKVAVIIYSKRPTLLFLSSAAAYSGLFFVSTLAHGRGS
jgi:hypothetical protein